MPATTSLWLLLLLTTGQSQGAPGAAAPQQAPADGPRYTLINLLERAARISPDIERAQAGVQAAQAKRQQANGARWPQMVALGGLGPSPQARGDLTFSPDSKNDPNINGVFARFELTAVQPLFTFGKIDFLRRAAEAGERVEWARVDEARGDTVVRIKELYFGKLLTGDLLALVDEISEALDEAVRRTERRLKGNAPNTSEADLYRFNSYRAIAAESRSEVVKNREQATAALRAFTGLSAADPVNLDATGLSIPNVTVERESESIRTALERRPEMRQARAGLVATSALARSEWAGLLPHFFVAITGYYAIATNRTFQENPFYFDPLNDRLVAAVLGVRYQLDFGITRGKVRELQAENNRVAALHRLGELGIPVEVIAVRRELTATEQMVRSTDEGTRNARRWLVVAQSNYDLGVGDARDVGDAVENYARIRSDNLMAIYRYNLALARLEHVTGRDSEPGATTEGEKR